MKIFAYKEKDTFIHSLRAVTKLLVFLMWTITGMLSYNTYVLLFMLVIGLIAIYYSKISFEEVSFVFWVMIIFLILNAISIDIFAPEQGVHIYGTRHNVTNFGIRYDLTYEQIFYELNVFLKYIVVAPFAFIFISTTNPSELAAGLNKLKIPYSICYAINIAFRYIPDIQEDFLHIKRSKEARGIDLSKKVSLFKRIKNTIPILFSLIFSSLTRIDRISTAMELRQFGKYKKRTWVAYKALKAKDYIVLICFLIFSILALYFTYMNGSRFYNPFI